MDSPPKAIESATITVAFGKSAFAFFSHIALFAENIRRPSGAYPGVAYDPSKRDGHVFPHWSHLVPGASPSSKSLRPSLDVLSRAVHIDISPLDSGEDLDDIAEGIRKVAEEIL